MKSIAIITARGGSKRIPKKNIKEFCGQPIISYSIKAAIDSGCFDIVMVSTDDEEIADVARKCGAQIPFMRSAETSNDYATTADVLNEVLHEYKKLGIEFDYHCCIYPTAPFVTAEKLRDAMEIIKTSNADSVAPFARFPVPPQWRCEIDEKNYVRFAEPNTLTIRSQDLPPMYYDPGQFYIYKTKKFLENTKNPFNNQAAIIVSELEVQDIDNMDDWKKAEIKYKLMLEKQGS